MADISDEHDHQLPVLANTDAADDSLMISPSPSTRDIFGELEQDSSSSQHCKCREQLHCKVLVTDVKVLHALERDNWIR